VRIVRGFVPLAGLTKIMMIASVERNKKSILGWLS
jgi:hypothetical protein